MPATAPAGAVEPQQNSSGSAIKSILQALAIFAVAQFAITNVTKLIGSRNQSSAPGGISPELSFSAKPDSSTGTEEYNPVPQQIAPIWPTNSSLDISIYVSPSLIMPALSHATADSLILQEKNFTMGDWKENRQIDTTFPVPKEVQDQGTLWAHFYVALHGHAIDPTAKDYNVATAYHFFRPLNQMNAKKKVAKTKKLLGSSNVTDEEVESVHTGPVFASYYHPNFTMSFIPDSGYQSYVQMHPFVRQHLTLEATGARDKTGQIGWYYPILYVNTFWQLRDHMMELNNTVKTLPIHITLNNLNNWKFALYASIDESVKQNQKNVASGGTIGAAGDGSEFEQIKSVIMDTNIYLLGTTAVVTVLHMVFEMLAFKSDISHWRNKKDNVGISVRTILANVAMQTVIFLYLMDNMDGTSWMILFGQGMGIVLEFWKITKTVNVRIRDAPPDSMIPYRVTFEDKHQLSETEKKTQEYDQIAFRYLYLVAIPLLGAYAVYSVLYDSHKSWYSFVITTLVGSVYAYGFLMMVPSLYINYRLKSVAHMPAKAMTYKFLNTFIDDLFAFTIKMPTLHRLATLRDDVIFFVYLYQSWAYKVDYTRVNEFGQGGDDEELEEKTANNPLAAPPDADASVKLPGAGSEGATKVTGSEKGKATKRK
ncbi:Cleft lip and palate transmembrane protein 1 like protein [Xylographa bjoerkii]|nr:Cleft lip and palate transmembrane protein 1 like protein [Xylographa bjoerkii]